MFDTVTSNWSTLPDLPVGVSSSNAGLVTYPDGHSEVVVVAGANTDGTQIFFLNNQTWALGPAFPGGSIYYSASVQFNNTFLVVAGYYNGYNNNIYMFDVATRDWLALPQTLAYNRDRPVAFMVPGDLLGCA
jgi:hypothetical protein